MGMCQARQLQRGRVALYARQESRPGLRRAIASFPVQISEPRRLPCPGQRYLWRAQEQCPPGYFVLLILKRPYLNLEREVILRLHSLIITEGQMNVLEISLGTNLPDIVPPPTREILTLPRWY
jgi:hypothetical protein